MHGLSALLLTAALCILLSACDQSADSLEVAALEIASAEEVNSGAELASTDTAMQKWSRSCALCHVSGVGGAPRTGNIEEWRPRLAQGKAVLLQHTIEGFNNMPPLGYCMSCEAADFVELIDFMAGEK